MRARRNVAPAAPPPDHRRAGELVAAARCSPRPWWRRRSGSAGPRPSLARAALLHTRRRRALHRHRRVAHGRAGEPVALVAAGRAALAAAAAGGVLRYLGADLLLYFLVVAATEAAAYAWESRQRGSPRRPTPGSSPRPGSTSSARSSSRTSCSTPCTPISALVWEDQARAERLLARLSELLRLTLRSGTRVETTLAEEVALLRHYAEIQEARYGDRLRVSFEVEPAGAGGAGAAAHPAAAGGERHPARHHPPHHARAGGSARLGGRGPAASRRAATTGSGSARGPCREGVGLSITRARLRQLYGAPSGFALRAAAARRGDLRALPSRSASRRRPVVTAPRSAP